ncbi:hypothetical protein [Vibrio panuliri]|uniref:Outer membrane protein beta-barrel domain-containing protein n=1 Tax=Vibrio panuliri TaxID=1381081 RepID=A0ABX3F6R2_9VIBR|nr:hypothetical protein [Vibrio panuliri]KAB1454272.1 hypothetical protein F7O85_15410 [Vibrio panuliri]OLQ84261.1 hypothetical protein BIY20_17835 [Vibrio panuliri]
MKKLALALAVAAIASPVIASDNAPDPSDLTQVNSFAFGTVDNDGSLKGMVGLAGQYSEGNVFMGLVEHSSATKSNEFEKKDQNSRLRYFQVLDTGLAGMPQAGFSVDYMKGWEKSNGLGTDIVALGAIAKVKTPWENLSIFPNVAYVKGKAQGEHEVGKKKIDLSGYQVNLFGSLSVGDAGEYVVLQPQFMHLDGTPKDSAVKDNKLSANVFKVKTGYGQPISADGKWWVEASHTYTRTDMDVKHSALDYKDNDHKFEFGVSYYF